MRRIIYFVLGLVCMVTGFIGYAVPGIPGTFPMILALGCFAKSSPRFENWLLNHPRIGPTLRGWRSDGSISMHHKKAALLTLWPSILITCLFVPWYAALAAAASAVGVSIYLLSRPTRTA